MAGESQQVPANRPDPSVVTTENIDKAVSNLRDEVIAWLDGRDGVLTERDLRYAERFTSQQLAVQDAFASSEKAISKAETSMEKRADATYVSLQELSRSLSALMPRTEAENRINANNKETAALATRVERIENVKTGGTEARAALYAAAGFLVSLLVLGGFIAALWPR